MHELGENLCIIRHFLDTALDNAQVLLARGIAKEHVEQFLLLDDK